MKNAIIHTKLTSEQIEKIGNSLIYLSTGIPNLNKTKALKLLYILDEESVKQNGIPFFNLTYKIWHLGPVAQEVFVDLSDGLSMFKDYIKKNIHKLQFGYESTYIPVTNFNDDEFSENDIKLMDEVISRYSGSTGLDLVNITHKSDSLWRIIAKEEGVLEDLESGKLKSTDYVINLARLLEKDNWKLNMYKEYQKLF